jgi:hypothetical protein
MWMQMRSGLVAVLAMSAIAWGCATETTTENPGECNAGDIASCTCATGPGRKVCAADDTWGACKCTAGGSGGAGGVGGSGGSGGSCVGAGDVCDSTGDGSECCSGVCDTQNQCE